MEKLAPTIIQAIKDHLCTFEEMDARKSTRINKLEARIITIKGILRHALGEEYSVEDMRSAEELAQAVADRLKQKSAGCNGENEVVSNILKSSMRPDFPWGDMSTAAIASVVLLRISELSRIEERQEKKCGELFAIGIELTNAKVPETGPGEKDEEPAERSILNRVQWLIKKKHELEMDNSVLEKRVTVLLTEKLFAYKDSIKYPENLSESQKQVLHALHNLVIGLDKEDKE
jgi:hypothetical protein